MQALKFVLFAPLVVTLLAACGGGGDKQQEEEERNRALTLAAQFAGDQVSDIPATDQSYDCVIHVALKPDPSASPLRDVVGRCIWSLDRQGSDAWVVTFRETWRCSDWAAEVQGYPPCNSVTGFHEWKYHVDTKENTVSQLDDRGQFAPDMRPNQ
jgi:hypothetical protein